MFNKAVITCTSTLFFISAKKPKVSKGHKLAEKFPAGETLRDLCKKSWTLGNVIGQGGFGLIYLGKLIGLNKQDF